MVYYLVQSTLTFSLNLTSGLTVVYYWVRYTPTLTLTSRLVWQWYITLYSLPTHLIYMYLASVHAWMHLLVPLIRMLWSEQGMRSSLSLYRCTHSLLSLQVMYRFVSNRMRRYSPFDRALLGCSLHTTTVNRLWTLGFEHSRSNLAFQLVHAHPTVRHCCALAVPRCVYEMYAGLL